MQHKCVNATAEHNQGMSVCGPQWNTWAGMLKLILLWSRAYENVAIASVPEPRMWKYLSLIHI
eukprot:9514157-Alexandrium_andersonii.AAC.1